MQKPAFCNVNTRADHVNARLISFQQHTHALTPKPRFFSAYPCLRLPLYLVSLPQSKSQPQRRGEYNVYSTFQSHEPEFDYLKSLEIEEKINKIRWLPQQNAAYYLLSTNGRRAPSKRGLLSVQKCPRGEMSSESG